MTHTPSPWRLNKKIYGSVAEGKHVYYEVSATDKAIWIAKVLTFTDDNGEYLANAQLISAAPELLEAAVEAEDYIAFILRGIKAGNYNCPYLNEAVTKRRQLAIVKAQSEAE